MIGQVSADQKQLSNGSGYEEPYKKSDEAIIVRFENLKQSKNKSDEFLTNQPTVNFLSHIVKTIKAIFAKIISSKKSSLGSAKYVVLEDPIKKPKNDNNEYVIQAVQIKQAKSIDEVIERPYYDASFYRNFEDLNKDYCEFSKSLSAISRLNSDFYGKDYVLKEFDKALEKLRFFKKEFQEIKKLCKEDNKKIIIDNAIKYIDHWIKVLEALSKLESGARLTSLTFEK